MRKTLVYGLLVATVATAGVIAQPTPAGDGSAAVDLKIATNRELVDGDLDAAVARYREIAARYRQTAPAVAASALVRMGRAYEKLGSPEARRTYEAIVRDFPAERDAVNTAHARLGSLSMAPLKTERVLERSDGISRVSPDGRFIVREDESENVALYEIATGQSRSLTSDGVPTDPEHRYPIGYAFSRDGKQLAYTWYVEKDDHAMLRIVATAEGTKKPPHTVYDAGDTEFLPSDWSPDGQLIAGILRRPDKVAQIGTLDIGKGRFRSLKTVDWSRVGGLRFSSDSKFLAYHRAENNMSFERDVFVIAVDGSSERPIAPSPADDTVLEWTPDGTHLLIASNRGGSTSIWSAGVNGAAAGSVNLVRSDVGVIASVGPATDGTLFYNLRPSSANIYTAQFDFATGQLASRPVRALQQFKGANTGGAWSPDGTRLAFVSRREIGSRFAVPILSLKTGEIERELTPELSYGGSGQWSPDGSRFLVRGAELKGRDGILTVDATSGDTTFLVGADVCSGVPYWAPDGKSFFCFDGQETAPEKAHIVQVDLTTRSVLRRYSSPHQGAGVSSDGRYILLGDVSVLDLRSGQIRSLLPPANGQPRVANFYSLTWVPDGRSVVFSGQLNGDQGMWLVPLDGTAPHKIRVDVPFEGIVAMRFNPKTTQVVFSPANPNSSLEMWKLENLLANQSEGGHR